MAVSPDGRWIVTGSVDQTSKVWDAGAGEARFNLVGHNGAVTSVAVSPDGRIVTGSADQTSKVWDANTGEERLTLRGHTDGITSVAISSNGLRIITGSRDRTVKVWDSASGREVLTLKEDGNTIRSVTLSPDGQRIVTGGGDLIPKLWEAASPRLVAAWLNEEQTAAEVLTARKGEQAATFARKRAFRAEDPGAIKEWLVLAPIAFEGRSGAAALEQEQIMQEGQLRPRAGERTRFGVWDTVRLDDYLIDFNEYLGELTQWSLGYAVCYIESQVEQSGLLLKVGSDDEAMVYLNGKEIYRCVHGRPYAPDIDVVTEVPLKAGLNVLVFKVVNEGRDWLGSVRFTDKEGKPVNGLTVTLDPDA